MVCGYGEIDEKENGRCNGHLGKIGVVLGLRDSNYVAMMWICSQQHGFLPKIPQTPLVHLQ